MGTLAKKKRKNTEMSSAGKKIEYSLTFLLFKEKKMFSSTPPSRIQKIHPPIFFSLFKKWKKRKLIQEDARPFQIKKKLIEQKHPIKKSNHATKNLLEKNLRTENSTFKKKKILSVFFANFNFDCDSYFFFVLKNNFFKNSMEHTYYY